ncbi:MAG: hypothetical protein R3E39_02385 [Anaerolineae bacterium]
MNKIHRWQLDGTAPYCLTLASDSRLSATDYGNDQIWETLLGRGESPALALQTRLGGRAGLVSLVPMWFHDGRPIYQAQAYAKPPQLTGFAPGYLRFQATLIPQLALQAEYWVMESHAVGIRFTLANAHTEPTDVGLDIIAFVGIDNKEQKLQAVPINDTLKALGLGIIGNLQPAIILEGGTVEGGGSLKLRQQVTIGGRKKVEIRLVHAGLPKVSASLALAQKWLQTDWSASFKKIEDAAQAIPVIETGDADTDTTIAFAYRELVQAFHKPSASLPFASVVATRQPAHGFNPADRGWSGQTAPLAYLTGLAAAGLAPDMAQGLTRNYLAVQQPDGWIDSSPGLAGQKQGTLCMPILARLTWGIFQYTEDSQFLKEVFPGLLKFFNRWLQPDIDKDGDGLPEWQTENQTGYPFVPTFATWQAWGGAADIRLVESPDLMAYLLSEAKSLKEIAYFLRDSATEATLGSTIQRLQTALSSLWNPDLGHCAYRDRDTHFTLQRRDIIADARGTDELLPAEKLDPPNRVTVRVAGGVNLLPKMTLKLDGFDAQGQAVSETTTGDSFVWAGGRGVYTSQQVFSQLDRVTFEGLSRVYRVDVHTVDTTRLDINALLPLWAVDIPPEQAQATLDLLTNPDHFWRSTGLSMNSAKDANFDPSNANGSGGVWLYWLTLLGEALIEHNQMEKATELVQRVLASQVKVLKDQKHFSEFYHSDAIKGLGQEGHVAGIVPLHLLMRVLGVRVVSSRKVWVGGKFCWGKDVTIGQHGVVVQRSAKSTHITFPSGHELDISGEAWQEVIDPNA